jgi:uncharacterized phage protein (possible DNA packaging)
MLVTLEEAKQYLRTDYPDDDSLTEDLIAAAEELVKGAGRFTDDTLLENAKAAKAAEYYAVAYLYEHREDADMHELTLMLRAILFAVREVIF